MLRKSTITILRNSVFPVLRARVIPDDKCSTSSVPENDLYENYELDELKESKSAKKSCECRQLRVATSGEEDGPRNARLLRMHLF